MDSIRAERKEQGVYHHLCGPSAASSLAETERLKRRNEKGYSMMHKWSIVSKLQNKALCTRLAKMTN